MTYFVKDELLERSSVLQDEVTKVIRFFGAVVHLQVQNPGC
jgi:hypothetical protein